MKRNYDIDDLFYELECEQLNTPIEMMSLGKVI